MTMVPMAASPMSCSLLSGTRSIGPISLMPALRMPSSPYAFMTPVACAPDGMKTYMQSGCASLIFWKNGVKSGT